MDIRNLRATQQVLVLDEGSVHVDVLRVGIQGPPGRDANASLRYVQGLAAAEWVINHGLDFYPNVTVIDSAGSVVEGEIEYLDEDNLVLRFSAPFTGVAYLS